MKECKCYKRGYTDAKAECEHEANHWRGKYNQLKGTHHTIDKVLKPLEYPKYRPSHGDGHYVVFISGLVTSTWKATDGKFDCNAEFKFIDVNLDKLLEE